MKISVCIPSYKRASQKIITAEYLPFVKVYVDQSEIKEYQKSNPKIKFIACKKGIQGNISRVRNYILDTEFKAGADVVITLDDDIKFIGYYENNKRQRLDSKNFLLFAEKYTNLCTEFGAHFWGININPDKQCYRENLPFSLLNFIGGPFQAVLKSNKCRYDEALPLKEDYDFTIQNLNKYRRVLRINRFFYEAKQSQQAGGCAVYRNRQTEQEQFDLLQKKWGSEIVKRDSCSDRSHKSVKQTKAMEDYNPIIRVPIKGV